ncbi:MAG: carboxypeptidase regulatory-like domain-containing protein [Phycisphaerales bacterium]|nr:carboxypeptidase regulatory-like domain-containing protein [Phycisphaerales bacterium]
MNLNQAKILSGLIAVCGMSAAASAQSTQVLFFENFDSVPLGMNVEEGIETGAGGPMTNVWSPDFPAGWSVDFNLPGIGVLEWQGWNIADGQWWAFTCGDQNRTDFVEPSEGGLGRGAIAIADSDEWDDYDANGLDPTAQGDMNTMMTTPVIDLTGVTPGSVNLSFFSSWRDESSQTAVVEVRYDGGAWEEALRWTSDDMDPNFHDDAENEIVNISLANPAAGSMEVRFSYLNGSNNWWWAVDTIQVTGEVSGTATNAPGYSFIAADVFNETGRPIINISEAAGADDYTVLLAKDAAFTDIRQSSTASASGDYMIPGIPNGIYWVKAVANNGAGSTDSENSIRIVVDNPISVDFNGDGNLNFFDVSLFLQMFNAGCP